MLQKEERINLTLEFINEHGYENLTQHTQHNGLNIGTWRNTQRQIYKRLKTNKEREAMKKEFALLPVDFLESGTKNKRKVHEWINLILEFINEHGYENLTQHTQHNGLNIGHWRNSQRQIYKRLKTNKEREAMKKEFALLPVDFLESDTNKSTQEWINLILEFINEHGYENLTQHTQHNGLNIGHWRNSQRQIYKRLKTNKEREAMRKEFSTL